MRRFPILLTLYTLVQSLFFSLNAQSVDLQPPLNIPIYLSGNFGELRSTHFHAGIDLKTQGVVGKSVFAVNSGYVSRFKVQDGGYGHVIYITHDNGYVSVYGHLNEFYPELETFLKEEQYKRKSNEVDVFPDKEAFPIYKGQKIAVSGNTGHSGGPHLHFELRNSSQVPLNALRYNLPIKDTISPKFMRLVVYNYFDTTTYTAFDKKIYKVFGKNTDFKILKPIDVGKNFAFGTEVYDFLNGSLNKCGVYSLKFYFDDTLIYSFKIDEISFAETHYIKSHLDYAEKTLNKRNVHRLYHEPNNKLSIYNEIVNNGILELKDTLIHNAKVIAADAYGNKSHLSFLVYRQNTLDDPKKDTGNVFVKYKEGITYENDVFNIKIPPLSLYADAWLSYLTLPSNNSYYSDIHIIGDELVAVDNYPTLKLKVTKPLNYLLPDKLVVVKLNDKGIVVSEGGQWNNGFVEAKISGFGKYALAADTIAPKIISLSFKNRGWYAAKDVISFKISDDLSGIKTYNGYINGKWVLFEYDPKINLLFYKVDAERLEHSKLPQNLEIYVLDERNNMGKYQGEFYY
jgi:hypothetical protein